jgi:hypothetical protein
MNSECDVIRFLLRMANRMDRLGRPDEATDYRTEARQRLIRRWTL